MKIEADILQEITELAGLFIPPKRIARIIEVDTEEFLSELTIEGSDIFRAFYTGFDKADVELRKSIIRIAKQGSQPAQEHAKKFITQLKSELHE